MTNSARIERFDPRRATETEFAGYHAVVAASEAADRPGEPGLPLAEVIGRLTEPLPGMGPAAHWVARRGQRLVALAEVHFLADENSGIALTGITVHPDERGAGIGTALLRAVVPELRARDRRTVEGWQVVAGTAGQRWAEARGFRPVRATARQALVVAEADPARWDVPVPGGYRLRSWIGAAPEDVVASYARARGAIHDAPLGESEFRWPEWTVGRVRAAEADFRAQGIEQRVVAAVHDASGDVAGFTEVCLHPRRPDWAYQRDTAVLAGHRGHGLGRCVKGHLTRWLVAERPAVARISTTTGEDNAHMLRVNRDVGYTTLRSMIAVRQGLEELTARLG
ncbi:GNAT family N-acetyltransferase [Amycolatopsis sp. NPDC021455]|uniref:GNAT family N-acetyltransferase n=1 Tax=Amycolatopsis sp. NPDC021455 TaxID=3154901 RepID=UPI0033EF8355